VLIAWATANGRRGTEGRAEERCVRSLGGRGSVDAEADSAFLLMRWVCDAGSGRGSKSEGCPSEQRQSDGLRIREAAILDFQWSQTSGHGRIGRCVVLRARR
jgi:hypothetical protein